MLPAPPAVLLQLDALTSVGLVLGRHVIASFARIAGKRDRRSLVGSHEVPCSRCAEGGMIAVPERTEFSGSKCSVLQWEGPPQNSGTTQHTHRFRLQPRCPKSGEAKLARNAAGVVAYLVILITRPAPTVRPPSRIANRKPSSIAIGEINTTDISVLSPGITISIPSGKETAPVTSVVRK